MIGRANDSDPLDRLDSTAEAARDKDLKKRVREVRHATGFDIRALAVDARRALSAKKAKKK